ncbi:MBL fold metallo-hydrolase RNA specificity domain-containing protein [Croceiramulus getboli]|nr:MBL fold metallo-hydrolase [Flavobacteriaceae bacterium YJPT1-3]
MSTAPSISQTTVQFLGAAKTVTGSKTLVEGLGKKLLIDCGVFQGIKELRQKNWDPLPVAVDTLAVVLLTHGHLDHVGYLPRLLKQGFQGEIWGTGPTLAIARIVLRDSGKIHEEEAEQANKEGYSVHHPALPFFTQDEAEQTIGLFQTIPAEQWLSLGDKMQCRFRPVGHILGACFIELEMDERLLVFSGDVGRPEDYLLRPPVKPEWADFLFLESTYGDRLHIHENPEEELARMVRQVVLTRGTLIIPTFAVERLQSLMYLLYRLYQTNRIPNIPIYVDSPMGYNTLKVFQQYPDWHKLSTEAYQAMCDHVHIVSSYAETWEVIDNPQPKIVIAGSGMVTGGRVLTYLKQLVDVGTTHILLVGFQAEGTRGRQLQEGAHEIRIFGRYYPVKAQVHQLRSLSAHADQEELLNWLDTVKNIPERVFLMHGEPGASDALRVKLQNTYQWPCAIPHLHEKFVLFSSRAE